MARKRRKRRFIPARDLECTGTGRARKVRRRYSDLPNFCFKIRSEGEAGAKTHFSEVFSGKTGKSVGFIGPNCTVVSTSEQAVRADYLNKMNVEDRLVNCVGAGWVGRTYSQSFKKALREAEKRTVNVTPRSRQDSASASRRRKRGGKE